MSCVLIIDDDDLIRELVETLLVSEGHDVVLARDGRDGIHQFRDRHIDLVVCDVFMPNQDGIETLRELRRMNPSLPIVMMTGGGNTFEAAIQNLPDVDFLRMTLMLGATKTIAKPFDVDALLALVRRCLGSRTRAGAARSIAGRQ